MTQPLPIRPHQTRNSVDRFRMLSALLVLLSAMPVALASSAYGTGAVLLTAAIVSVTWVDRYDRSLVPAWLTHLGALAIVSWTLMEYSTGRVPLPEFALAHFFMWIAVCKFITRKSNRDDGLILVVALLLLVVSARVSVTVVFPLMLVLFLMLGTYVAGLFHFRLEAARRGADTLGYRRSLKPGRGLEPVRLGVPTALIVACSTVAAVAAFLFVPRFGVGALGHAQGIRGSVATGFDDSVVFGGLRSRIRYNDALVMRLVLRRAGVAYGGPDIQPYLRGQTLEIYRKDRGRWMWRHEFVAPARSQSWEDDGRTIHLLECTRASDPDDWIEQDITLVAPARRQPLFSIYPPVRFVSNGFTGVQREWRAQLLTANPSGGRGPRYVVYSPAPIDKTLTEELQSGTKPRRARMMRRRFISARIKDYTDTLLSEAGIDPDDHAAVAETIAGHLRSDRFAYTLEPSDVDPNTEPIEDFLYTRRRGHCEYFASAMTIMCQLAGVPVRMVTGYHGGNYNEIGRFYEIRENHAHSWVEVFLLHDDWVVFDPTPASTDTNLAGRPGWAAWLGAYLGYWQFSWASHVIGYDADTQESMLLRIRQWIQSAEGDPTLHPTDATRIDSARRFREVVMRMVAIAVGVGIAVLLFTRRGAGLRLRTGVRRWLLGDKRPAENRVVRHPDAVFYDDFVTIARRLGWVRAPHQTPREFAVQVARSTGDEVPLRDVADALYKVEYGRGLLDDNQRTSIHQILAALKSLSHKRQRTDNG